MDDATTPQVSGEAGGADLPSPTFSDQATSSPSVDADAIVNAVISKLEPLIDRKVQSTKDKRFSEIEKALTGRGQTLAELEAEGVSIPENVRTKMEIRELKERLDGQQPQPAKTPDAGPSGSKAAVTEAISTLQQYGLDANDPAFIELLRGQYKNPAEFQREVYKHVVTKLAPQKPASPAGVVQAPATGGIPAPNVDALTQEYKTKMLAARGNKTQITALRNEYKEKGVNVYAIDFT